MIHGGFDPIHHAGQDRMISSKLGDISSLVLTKEFMIYKSKHI